MIKQDETENPLIAEKSLDSKVEEHSAAVSPNSPQQPDKITKTAKPAADRLNWSVLAFDLELDAIARQIALNSIVQSYHENTLKLSFLPELELMLKPDIEKQIKQALEQQLGVSLNLEFISTPSLDAETPHQADLRQQEEERQAVIQQIRQDEVYQQLHDVFGAELIEQSVRKRTSEKE